MADTNTFLAVALDEPQKQWLIETTGGHDLVAPAVLPYEIANALSALVRRRVLTASQAALAWEAASAVPVELASVELPASLRLAARLRTYAYDAYFLQCALQTTCPLLTLDRGMKRWARYLEIEVVE